MKFESTKEDRIATGLTIYQNDFGIVKEVRKGSNEDEVNEVYYTDIARNLETSSVLVKGLDVLEQRYLCASIRKSKLLERYIGCEVMVHNRETGEKLKIRLLDITDGLIGERMDTKELVIDPAGELVLPPMPEKLVEKPVLVWRVGSGKMNEHIKVWYTTPGIGWTANYKAEIQGTALYLTGWMEIRNDTGLDFNDTAVKLIAGEVHRQPQAIDFSFEFRISESTAGYPHAEEFGFGDYPSYKLNRPMTLLDGQTKQIAFLEAAIASFRTVYVVDKWSERARIKVEFDNKKANGLGISLPRGIVKLYRYDTEEELEFMAEGRVGSLIEGDTASVQIGEAFNVSCRSGEKKRWKNEGVEYVTYGYDLVNGKEENIRIHISHVIDEPIWKMESSSHDYQIKNRGHIEFIVRMSAKKAVAVEFTYQVVKS